MRSFGLALGRYSRCELRELEGDNVVAKIDRLEKFSYVKRNPNDSSQTSTGRRSKPNWLADAVKKGAKLESFAI